MNRIIINNHTELPTTFLLSKVFEFISDTKVINEKNEKYYSYPMPITFDKYVCFYGKTKTTQSFTFKLQ